MESGEKINEIVTRGVEDVFVKESLLKRLNSGIPLRVKFGIDPTGTTIHIGRAVPLWKLRAFQELGHQIVLIVGDFTAQIGDASDKLEKRPMLSEADVKNNLKQYKKIIGKIIDVKKAEFVFNSKWLAKLSFKEACQLAESFSVQQMSGRRNFKERFDKGEEVSLREFMYPLMQGYDSVAVRADVEIGGFDQLFNLKAGRTIQKHFSQPEQDVLTVQMLEGTDGRKMSTSWGNVINITDEPNDMFGKVMSVRDELIPKYFLLCTQVEVSEIEKIKIGMSNGELNPRDAKIKLAEEIVALYHSRAKAKKASKNFKKVFSEKKEPAVIPEVLAGRGEALADITLLAGVVPSKSEWRRLVEGGAVSEIKNGQKITDPSIKLETDMDLRIGKHRFLKIKIK